MGDPIDAPRLKVIPTRLERDERRNIVVGVAVAQLDEKDQPVAGQVTYYTAKCAGAISEREQAWDKKIDFEFDGIKKSEELNRSVQQAENKAAHACSAQGWQWQATKTEPMTAPEIQLRISQGNRLLRFADAALFDAAQSQLVGKPKSQGPADWDIDDPTRPNDR